MADDDGPILIPTGGFGIATQKSIPDWVYKLKPLAALGGAAMGALIAFANDPVGFVWRIISLYIVNGIFTIAGFVVGAILQAFDIVAGAIQFAGSLLVGAFGAVGLDILGVLVDLQQELAGVVAGAGAAGPIVAIGGTAVLLVVLYRVTLALVELVPGGGSVLTLLGLK